MSTVEPIGARNADTEPLVSSGLNERTPIINAPDSSGFNENTCTSKIAAWSILISILFNWIAASSVLPDLTRISRDHFFKDGYKTSSILFESSIYLGAGYTLFPVIGGVLADAYHGKYKIILLGLFLEITSVVITIFIFAAGLIGKSEDFTPPMIVFGVISLLLGAAGLCFFISCVLPFLGFHCTDIDRPRYFLWYVWVYNVSNGINRLLKSRIEFILVKNNLIIDSRLNMYNSIFRFVCLIISVIILLLAKKFGKFNNLDASGFDNVRKLTHEYFPQLWKSSVRNDDGIKIIRHFVHYLSVILAGIIAFDIMSLQPSITIFYEGLDNQLIKYNCTNHTHQGELKDRCYWSYWKSVMQTNEVLSVGPAVYIILIPIIQWCKAYRSYAGTAYFDIKLTRIDMSVSLMFGAVGTFCVMLFGFANHDLSEKLYSTSSISLSYLIPCSILLSTATVLMLQRVYTFAFNEARRNLPGLECLYSSLIVMCMGIGGLLSYAIFAVIFSILENGIYLTEKRNFFNAKCRMIFYVVLIILAVLMSALLMTIPSKEYTTYLPNTASHQESSRLRRRQRIRALQARV